MKYEMKEIAKNRLKKLQEHKAKGKDHKMPMKPHASKYDMEDEEMSADMEERTPAEGTPPPKHLMHKGHPGLGGQHEGAPKGIAVMIGIGKPMPHGMPQKHPGLGESIEDEEPVMGGKYRG